MLQEVHPSRLGPRGVRCPGGYLFIGGGEGQEGRRPARLEKKACRGRVGTSRAPPGPRTRSGSVWPLRRGGVRPRRGLATSERERLVGASAALGTHPPSFCARQPALPSMPSTFLPSLGKQKRGTGPPKGGGCRAGAQQAGRRGRDFGLTKTQPGFHGFCVISGGSLPATQAASWWSCGGAPHPHLFRFFSPKTGNGWDRLP